MGASLCAWIVQFWAAHRETATKNDHKAPQDWPGSLAGPQWLAFLRNPLVALAYTANGRPWWGNPPQWKESKGLRTPTTWEPLDVTKWPPTFTICMGHPLLGGWWPKGSVGHDAGAGLVWTDGRTPMDKGTPLEHKHIPRSAWDNAFFRVCLDEGVEILSQMIMPLFSTRSLLAGVKFVATWPNWKCPRWQRDNGLITPLVMLIPMWRCLWRIFALAGFSPMGGPTPWGQGLVMGHGPKPWK